MAKKTKHKNKSNIVTNSIKTLKTVHIQIKIKILGKKNKPGQGNSTHRGRNELDLFEEQRSQCGWRVGSRGREEGGSELPAGLACLEDHDTQVDFLPEQQEAAIGSQV